MLRRRFLFCPMVLWALGAKAQEIAFDEEHDIVVVGGGGAGLAAAARAGELGADVILLEKNNALGGNTLISGGFLGVVDNKRQKNRSYLDSPERHIKDIWENGDRIANKKLIECLVKESPRMLAWIESKGVKFQDSLVEIYGSHFPRCHVPLQPNGLAYVRALSAEVMRNKIPVLTSCKVIGLIENSSGRVIGVRALHKGRERNIRARKAVILAAGGFGANRELVSQFDPRLTGLATNSSQGSTGEVLLAASRLGADVVDMEQIQCLPGPLPNGKIRARLHNNVQRFIFVNSEGKRFVDERSRRDVLTAKVLELPEKRCFCIIDQAGLESYDLLVQRDAIRAAESGDAVKADSIAELASKLRLDPKILQQTVTDRNSEIKEDKTDSRLPISKPPFWASIVTMRIHYTMGGVKIDERAQCLRSGKPISGLFAAGEITGGIHGKNRIGGNGLADALTFGMIAGENAFNTTKNLSQ